MKLKQVLDRHGISDEAPASFSLNSPIVQQYLAAHPFWSLAVMVVRSIITRSLKHTQTPVFTQNVRLRYLTTSNTRPKAQSDTTPPRQQNWLTRQVKSSPTALKYFLKVARLMGYISPQQIAARRALYIYREICAVKADEDSEFWTRGECHRILALLRDHKVSRLHANLILSQTATYLPLSSHGLP